MKSFIVIIASIILGAFIYNLVAGNDNSIKTSMRNVWINELNQRNYVEMVDNK